MCSARMTGGQLPVIALFGVGQIGGSLGMAWRKAGATVLGVDREPPHEAVRLGALDQAATLEEALAQADVLVLAAPLSAVLEAAERFGSRVRPGTVVTDVSSVKGPVVEAWNRALAPGAAFVGGHPMFGREVSGVANASPELARGSRWILTPSARSTAEAVTLVQYLALLAGAGAVPAMTPEEHDRRIAAISHLPQMVATALAAAAMETEEQLGNTIDLSAGGFRDTTRIAGSPAAMWTEILLANRGALREVLTSFRQALDALEEGDAEAIRQVFSQAHAARLRLPVNREER
ncbi:MAG TPA: prephenate dehydrogenase/arogenate dehydrogenase family protein [Symbiobacteriaceae bacterium]|nr:prephenate dehydrogenase/arogenate dehydrogenase family protein [Symbiobacteriaceae bacterium]